MARDIPPRPSAPKRSNLHLIVLIVLACLVIGNGALWLNIHAHHAKPASVPPPPPAPVTPPAPPAPPPAPAAPVVPRFDIVRVGPQGNSVIAGRAQPGVVVTIKDGDHVLGTAKADAQGAFVFVSTQPILPGMHEITLFETLADGTVITGTQSASINLPGNGKDAFTVLSGPEGSRVLSGQGPQPGVLAMGAVDYDTHGHAIFSGTAPFGATVTVMMNGQALGSATVDKAGYWHLSAPVPTKPGIITLRAVKDGHVFPSVSVPFAPEELSTALASGHVVITQGDSLWMIARQVYGHGTLYSLIYSANASQIHNPNLIFPGQAFVLPKP